MAEAADVRHVPGRAVVRAVRRRVDRYSPVRESQSTLAELAEQVEVGARVAVRAFLGVVRMVVVEAGYQSARCSLLVRRQDGSQVARTGVDTTRRTASRAVHLSEVIDDRLVGRPVLASSSSSLLTGACCNEEPGTRARRRRRSLRFSPGWVGCRAMNCP